MYSDIRRLGFAKWQRVHGVSNNEPQDLVSKEILDSINELVEMGLIEVVGNKSDGEWLYGPTDAGKRAVQIWRD